MLVDCIAGLARQTHPIAGVVVVDTASSDGTREHLSERVPAGLNLEYVRLDRNGGGAEGFHYGVARARRDEGDWLWLMDDDCVPEPDALERLLASPRASDPDVVALAPLVVTPGGDPMPLNRGWLRPRWFRMPLVGLAPRHYSGEHELDFTSLVGPLVRMSAARAIDPPRRDFFIWYDDLEYFLRVRGRGALWLVPSSRMVHRDVRELSALTLGALVREFARGYPFADRWKRIYGLRNMLFCGRRHGFLNAAQAARVAFASVARALLFESHKLLTLRLVVRYARDGWRGRFLNLPPDRWRDLPLEPQPLRRLERDALRYDEQLA